MKPLLARISAVDCRGVTCCPDLLRARRLCDVSLVVMAGDASDDLLRYAERLRTWARFVLRPGGRAAQAALLEELAGVATVVCAGDGGLVETQSLAERLRAGTVWS